VAQVIVKIARGTLIFDSESQLISGLKPEALELAIKKGKGYLRATQSEARNEKLREERDPILKNHKKELENIFNSRW
jgi:hypothetical protein